jgi:hypothetical protein
VFSLVERLSNIQSFHKRSRRCANTRGAADQRRRDVRRATTGVKE